MQAFEAWDVVKVPFPYTDRPVRQRRPALVLAAGQLQEAHGLLWVLMITSAENRGWPGDIGVSDLTRAGLPAASVVRTAKIATIEARDAERIGSLHQGDRAEVTRQLHEILAGVFNRSGASASSEPLQGKSPGKSLTYRGS